MSVRVCPDFKLDQTFQYISLKHHFLLRSEMHPDKAARSDLNALILASNKH